MNKNKELYAIIDKSHQLYEAYNQEIAELKNPYTKIILIIERQMISVDLMKILRNLL